MGMYFKLHRKHPHSTFSRVQSIRTRERHPLPGKKNTQVYIITFKAASLKKGYPLYHSYFLNLCFVFEYFDMVP